MTSVALAILCGFWVLSLAIEKAAKTIAAAFTTKGMDQ